MTHRTALGAASVFLNLLLMIMNLLAFGIGTYLDNSVDVHKHFIDGSRYGSIVLLMRGTAMILSFTNFWGVIACSCALMTSAERGGCGSWLALHMAMLFLFSWFLVLTGSLMIWEGIGLEMQISTGFNSSMLEYSVSAEAKERIDRLQMEYQCCGFENLTNWLKTQWFNSSLIRDHTNINRTDPVIINAVPFSCCNTSADRPCTNFALTSRQDPTIYTPGCAVAVPSSFRLRMIFIGGIVALVMVPLSWCLCLMIKTFFMNDNTARETQQLLDQREERRLLLENEEAERQRQLEDEDGYDDEYDDGDRERKRRKRKKDVRRRKKLRAKKRRKPRR